MLDTVTGNWFIDNYDAVNVLADCKKMGRTQLEVSFSILDSYINHILDYEKHDYRIITDCVTVFEDLCDKDKIIPTDKTGEYFEKLEAEKMRKPSEKTLNEKTLYIFIEELKNISKLKPETKQDFIALLSRARYSKRCNIRFVIITESEKNNVFTRKVNESCDAYFIYDESIMPYNMFIVSKKINALKYIIEHKKIRTAKMQKDLFMDRWDATQFLNDFESHGIIEKFKRKRTYKVVTQDFRKAYFKLKTKKPPLLFVANGKGFGEDNETQTSDG